MTVSDVLMDKEINELFDSYTLYLIQDGKKCRYIKVYDFDLNGDYVLLRVFDSLEEARIYFDLCGYKMIDTEFFGERKWRIETDEAEV